PVGRISSSAEFFLPAKRSDLAARLTRSAAGPRALRVAGPSFNPSSQNTTSTPFAGAAKPPKASLRASVIGRGSLWSEMRTEGSPRPYGAGPRAVQSPKNGNSGLFSRSGPQDGS